MIGKLYDSIPPLIYAGEEQFLLIETVERENTKGLPIKQR